MVWPIWANPILANLFLANPFFCVVVFWLVLVCVSVLCCLFFTCLCWCVLLCVVGVCCCLLSFVVVVVVRVGGVSGCWFGPPSAGPPPPDPPPPDRPKISLFFFPSPATVFILFSLSCWSFSLNFGGVFEDRDPQMCTFGVLGLLCETSAASGARRGFTRQPENSKRAHLSAPALQTPPKFHEKDQQESEKRIKNCGGKGKKTRNFGHPTPSGPHHSGPIFSGFGTTPFEAPP